MTVVGMTGATGALGGLVLDHIRDLHPRLIVRDPSRAPVGFDTRQATYADQAACEAAFAGLDILFMVSAAESATRRAEHRCAIAAAAAAGVRHIVYTSFIGASLDATFTLGRDHADSEAAIAASGMRFTILRDSFYLDLMPHLADAEGVIRGPAGDGVVGAVSRLDVAEVAATVLRNPAPHENATYTLTGPEALSLGEVATRLSSILGRDIRFEDESEAAAYEWRRRDYGAEEWQLDAWVSTYTAIKDGSVAALTNDVAHVLGRAPRDLEAAFASNA